jgi:hypothetical protein
MLLGVVMASAWLVVRRRVLAWRIRQIVKRILELPE